MGKIDAKKVADFDFNGAIEEVFNEWTGADDILLGISGNIKDLSKAMAVRKLMAKLKTRMPNTPELGTVIKDMQSLESLLKPLVGLPEKLEEFYTAAQEEIEENVVELDEIEEIENELNELFEPLEEVDADVFLDGITGAIQNIEAMDKSLLKKIAFLKKSTGKDYDVKKALTSLKKIEKEVLALAKMASPDLFQQEVEKYITSLDKDIDTFIPGWGKTISESFTRNQNDKFSSLLLEKVGGV